MEEKTADHWNTIIHLQLLAVTVLHRSLVWFIY